MNCEQVAFIVGSPTRFTKQYPSCSNGDSYVPIHAGYAQDSLPEEIGAALQLTFGLGLWIALFLHVVGVEIYVRFPLLNLTDTIN